jgi:hypothetical protein
VTIIPKPGHLPTPDNRQGKQRTSGSDQVIWQGDKLHYWQFMELKSSISFVFFWLPQSQNSPNFKTWETLRNQICHLFLLAEPELDLFHHRLPAPQQSAPVTSTTPLKD